MLEGGVSETWNAFATGSVLTAWALYLGADASTIAILQGLATGAQIAHGPAGFLTEWLGRKRVAIGALTLARLCWAPIAALPLLGLDGATATRLLIATAAVSAILQVLGLNAWTAWMGDVVPASLRGRFFGARTVFVTGGAALASLACALLLESDLPRELSLPAIAALLCVTGVVSAGLLARQVEPLGKGPRCRPDLREYGVALLDPNARGLLAYQFGWGFAIAPGAAFFALHVSSRLENWLGILAIHAIAVAVVRVFTAPLWGRAVDAWGARPVLALCSLAISVNPLLWCLVGPHALWPLAIDAIVSGCAWGGHAVASFDLPLTVAPPRRRSYYLALFAMAGGVGFAIATGLCSWAAATFSVESDVRAFFVMSALGRAACALVAARVHDPESIGVRTLIGRIARSSAS